MADCEADQLREEVARLAQQVDFYFVKISLRFVLTWKFKVN